MPRGPPPGNVEVRPAGRGRRARMRATVRKRKGLAAMSQDNQITLRGYLTAEPRLYQKTPTSIPVTTTATE